MKEENLIRERYELTIERISTISKEETVAPLYRKYFQAVAEFILDVNRIYSSIGRTKIEECSIDELIKENRMLYEDVLTENYHESYANPAYATSVFGREMGQFLSFLYVEMRAQIAYAYERRISYLTICNELFIEIYNAFEEEETPNLKNLKEIVYWYASDYSDVFLADRVEEKMNPKKSFATDIVMKSNLTDTRYLYLYGEYIAEEEHKTAAYLNSLEEDNIDKMADVYAEGYKEGCEEIGIELKGHETVCIQYAIGTERLVKQIIAKFENMGLETTICRNAVGVLTRDVQKNGFYSRSMNPQYEFDHMMDQGLFLNKKFVERKLDVMKNVYEQHMELASKFVGCVIVGVEEESTEHKAADEAIRLNEKQTSLQMFFEEKVELLTNKYLLKELNIQVVDIEEKHQ